jgi:lysophospholipid acyltransferase
MVGVYGIEMTGVFLALALMFYFPCRYRMVGPGWSSFWALAVLGLIHYEALLAGTATDRMSHTGTLMVMVAKISMFAFHVNDGHKKASGLILSANAHIGEHRAKLAVDSKSLSLFGYLVYMFEFQGSLVGPLFSYQEYLDFYNRRGDFKQGLSVPFLVPFLKSAIRAFALLGSYVFLTKQWWFGADTLVTDWFANLSFPAQLLVSSFLVAGCRLAYYAVWGLSEVACTLSGLSFVPPARFTRGRNVNLRLFEFSSNFNSVTNNWNIRTSDLWLKQCIYQRVESVPRPISMMIRSRKGLANFTTKLTSALWHGWYPGYCVSFLSMGLCNWSETLIRKKIHPRLPAWLTESFVGSVLGWMHTWWSVNLFFAPFLLLTWDKLVRFYVTIHWCGHLYHLGIIVFCSIMPSVKTDTKKSD